MPKQHVIRARWVIPIDRPPIEGGVVTIADGRIVAVGSTPAGEATVRDVGDVALLPGFVNAHTHLEFSDCTVPCGQPGTALPDWIRLVLAERAKRDRSPQNAIRSGMLETLRGGTTTVGEIATLGIENYPAELQDACIFLEVIGWSRARAESAFAAFRQRLSDAAASSALSSRGSADGFRLGVSPHAPYTVGVDLLERLVETAVADNRPLAMHLAESPEELTFLANGSGPFRELLEERGMWDAKAVFSATTPLDYLLRLGRAPRVLVIHGNFLSAIELEYLAQHRGTMALIYCPRTHEFFDHPPYPLESALSLGACVALGTDSRASNPDLCMLSEMRAVHRRHPAISPQSVLRMGTQSAADALGLGSRAGSLTPGKIAHLVTVPLDRGRSNDVVSRLLGSDAPPNEVWLRGSSVQSP